MTSFRDWRGWCLGWIDKCVRLGRLTDGGGIGPFSGAKAPIRSRDDRKGRPSNEAKKSTGLV